MKKLIALFTLFALFGAFCFADQTVSNITLVGSVTLEEDEYTAAEVGSAVGDALAQWGAWGYSADTNVTVDADTWTDVPASFTVTYASGFEYLSGATVTYTNGTRAFLFLGSCSITAGSQGSTIQVGIETNGVYVAGSTSGPRAFAVGASGSMSYNVHVTLDEGDTVGLVIRSGAGQTIDINTWQSTAIRF